MSEVIDGTESAGIKDPIKEKRCATDEIDDGPLTSEDTALNDVGTITYGITDMADDPRLEQAFSLIRAVIADADQRAQDDIVARISGKPQRTSPSISEPADKRAPKGSAAALIDRALEEAGDDGLTVIGIQATAKTDFEKMVSTSAIRNWLKEWERKRPQKYRHHAGVWYLAGRGPASLKVV
jgi:hypothetical protein